MLRAPSHAGATRAVHDHHPVGATFLQSTYPAAHSLVRIDTTFEFRPRSCPLQPHHPASIDRSFLSSLLVLSLLEHLLHDLLLLNQEIANNTIPHAVATSRATVCALHSLVRSAGRGVLSGSEGGDLSHESLETTLSIPLARYGVCQVSIRGLHLRLGVLRRSHRILGLFLAS